MRDAWAMLLERVSEWQLRTVVTFGVHELFYWGTFIPFWIADRIPYARRWKVQPESDNGAAAIAHCAWRVMLNHCCLVLPIIFVTHPLYQLMGTTHHLHALPSLVTLIAQVVFFFIVEDFVFYWGHRALHTPFLYRHVHSVHHHHAAPFGIAAEYAHPFEVMFLGAATLAGPMLVGPHLLTLYIYLALRCVQTVECHSGYDFPWSLNRWLPLYGGADFHDHHHRIHSGNYSSTFTWVDKMYGTDAAYKLWKRKQIAEKSEYHSKTT